MGLFKDQCRNIDCRHYLPKGALFCPECKTAQRTDKSGLSCSHCGAGIETDYAACSQCGRPVNIQEAVQDKIIADRGAAPLHWVRDRSEFANRIALSKGNRLLSDSLIVEHGTTAMILVDGAFEGLVTGGRYEIEPREDTGEAQANQGLLSRVASFFTGDGSKPTYPMVTAILVDSSHSPTHFSFDGIRTQDGLIISSELDVFIAIDSPDVFARNVLRGADSYSHAQLKQDFETVLRNALAMEVGRVSYEELALSFDPTGELLSRVIEHCKNAMQNQGFAISRLKSASFYSQEMEEVADLKAQATVIDFKERAELSASKKRLAILDELLSTRNQQKQKEILSNIDMEIFEGEQDQARTLREWKKNLFEKELGEKEEDRLHDRVHKLKLEELACFQELEKLKRKHDADNRSDDMVAEEEVLDHEIKIGQKKTDAELAKAKKIFEEKQIQENAENLAKMTKAERAMDLQKKWDAHLRLEDEYEAEKKAKTEEAKRKHESEDKKAEREHELKLAELKATQERERIKSEQEGRSNESELKERHSREKEALLRERIDDLKQESTAIKGQAKQDAEGAAQHAMGVAHQAIEGAREREKLVTDNMDRVEGVLKHSLDRVTDAATGSHTSSSTQSTPQSPEKVTICPTCRNEITAGFRHCPHCGHKFFG
jgi:hypothetical protein